MVMGLGNNLSTVYGLILELRNLLEVDNKNTRNTETVQGCINTLNDIIGNFSSLVPGEFLICDNNGKVSSASWTTKQDYLYTNEGSGSKSATTSAENQWINLAVNSSTKKITLTHKAHIVANTTSTENKNDSSNTSNTISLYAPIVDNCGHIVGKNTKTITLPYGYKTLSSNQISAGETDFYTTITPSSITNGQYTESSSTKASPKETNTSATTIKDTIKLDAGNKWIQTKVTNQSISLAHEIHNIEGQPKDTNLNVGKVNTITVQDLAFDAAGHITASHPHTYTLWF